MARTCFKVQAAATGKTRSLTVDSDNEEAEGSCLQGQPRRSCCYTSTVVLSAAKLVDY